MASKNDSNKKKSPNKSQSKDKASKKSGKKNIFKWTLLSILFLCLTVSVVAMGYVFAIIKSTPPLNVNSVLELSQPSRFVFRDETFMTNIKTEKERFVVESSDIPKTLKDAYVSIEDERFYEHKGIDPRRMVGALVNNVKNKLSGSGGLHGGSTLTQQLLKNTILTNETSMERKIKEQYLALNLEKHLSKDEIITAYLNTIPLGGTAYGVEAAAYLYFGKSVSELNLLQCAYLAGITQAPTTYSCYNPKNQEDPSKYVNRTITVLGKMLELGYINQEEHDKAVEDARENKFEFNKKTKATSMDYQWVAYPALDQVRNDLKEKYKYTDEEITKLIVNGGLTIFTTVDKGMQDFTQATLDNFKNLNLNTSDTVNEDGMPLAQASATIMDPYTGEVLAIVGGRGPHKPKSLNRAYDGLRSIGSTTKPLTAYGAAIDQKIMTAATPLDDAPLPESIGKKYPEGGKPWNPQNYDHKFEGIVNPRHGVLYSKNVPTVLTVNEIGVTTAANYGKKYGLVYTNNDDKKPSTLALGQFTVSNNDKDGGNTTILASAFSTFVNGGERSEAKLYTKVTDSQGNVILENKPSTVSILSPQSAYIMYDILKGTSNTLATRAKFGNMPIAGKTGTTTNNHDLLYAGTTPYYSGAIWLGYDVPKKLPGSSNASAANLWGILMKKFHEGKEYKDISMPEGIVKASVCKDSGKSPTDLCSADQRGGRVYTELFIKGTQPTSLCETHVKAKVNKNNNKLATDRTPSSLIEERVFIKKEHASQSAADYKYVLPTSTDDTIEEPIEPEEGENGEDKIDLNSLIIVGMKASDAKALLEAKGLNVILDPASADLSKFTVESFSSNAEGNKVSKGDTVTLKLKEINQAPQVSN